MAPVPTRFFSFWCFLFPSCPVNHLLQNAMGTHPRGGTCTQHTRMYTRTALLKHPAKRPKKSCLLTPSPSRMVFGSHSLYVPMLLGKAFVFCLKVLQNNNSIHGNCACDGGHVRARQPCPPPDQRRIEFLQ